MSVISQQTDKGNKYSNPFRQRDIYPFNDIKRCLVDISTKTIVKYLHDEDSRFDENKNLSGFDETKHEVMVKIPAFYHKKDVVGDVVSDSILAIAPTAVVSGEYSIMDIFNDNGKVRPYILVGAFELSEVGGRVRTVPSKPVVVNENMNTMRSKLNEGFSLMNYGTFEALTVLYKILYADTNSQEVVGEGISSNKVVLTGNTVTIGTQSGYGVRWGQDGDVPSGKIIGIVGLNEGRFDWWAKDGTSPNGVESVINTGDNGVFYDENALEVL